MMEQMEQTPIFRKYDINMVVDPVCGEIGSPAPRYKIDKQYLNFVTQFV